MSVSDYTVFGLRIRSEIDLPELHPAEGDSQPDVVVRKGRVARPDNPRPGIEVLDGALLLTIPDVAHFSITGGNEIVVEPGSEVPERNVRLFLLGSAFGALLHQRGLLPLHANAIEVDGRAVAFMGKSGAGKSTLAAGSTIKGFECSRTMFRRRVRRGRQTARKARSRPSATVARGAPFEREGCRRLRTIVHRRSSTRKI